MIHTATRNIRLLNSIAFLNGFRAYEGVMAVYFATITESFTMGMTVFAILNLSASVFEVPTGVLSDAIGRKKTIVIYSISSLTALLLYYFADSATLLIAGSIASGFAMAMRSGALSAYIYENLEVLGRKDDFRKVEGRRLAMNRYSIVIAGLIGTIIIFYADIRSAMLLSLVTLTISLCLTFWLRDVEKYEPRKANIYANLRQAWQGFLDDAALRDISLGRMISRGMGNSEYRFRSIFFSLIMPEWLVNLLGILNNFISGVAMHYAHSFVKRFGFTRTLVHFDILDRISTTVFVMLNNITGSVFMNITTSASFGLREVAAEDLLQSRYSKEQRATMGSLVGLAGGLIYGATAIILGFLADQIGVFYTMLLIQPLMLTSAYYFRKGIRLGNH